MVKIQKQKQDLVEKAFGCRNADRKTSRMDDIKALMELDVQRCFLSSDEAFLGGGAAAAEPSLPSSCGVACLETQSALKGSKVKHGSSRPIRVESLAPWSRSYESRDDDSRSVNRVSVFYSSPRHRKLSKQLVTITQRANRTARLRPDATEDGQQQRRATYVGGVHQAAVEGRVAVRPLQQRLHRLGVQPPPHEQVVGVQVALVRGQRVTFDLAPLRVVGVAPRLHLAQEVDHLGFAAVPCVGVHEHTLAVVCEAPAVQLGEGHAEVGTLHQRQVSRVARVHHVHQEHLVEDGAEGIPTTHGSISDSPSKF
ncbi:hypothetical protein EYF80_011533 [Liparis tanakae]|uniref:Uncharacterized protein n=1 Tax=Liparis tanakae TaxID=230148 RepID=A0A4Z2IMB9_9TELE|nr:hypothetical protein EYF80_011533 [Liparis tanakae]